MEPVPEYLSFPKSEEETKARWDAIDAFGTCLKRSENLPEYSFYDGPPFATGLPHYGHILAGTIKDTVTRYAHQTGHHVTRRFGWDTHGLPIEFEIDKELGVKTKDDVMAMGIPKYNKHCRAIVMRYASEWEVIVKRLGRWIDFENDYKTMDVTFMESVWWVFKTLWKKNLVYRGFKVMPYSTACTTPLSNFEAKMEYKDVNDPAVYVSFPLIDEPKVSLVAWTTTPWTLPSNLALAVNPKMDYVRIRDVEKGQEYILLETLLSGLYPTPKKKKGKSSPPKYEIKDKFKGEVLSGKRYEPIFPYFAGEGDKGAFRVILADYVTDSSGTGVVHCAPAFGEDDYRVCLENGVCDKGEGLVCPVDVNGKFTDEVPDFAGLHVKEADKAIIAALKASKRLVKSGQITHSYPYCWRSDTPLIYKAVPSWFVAVEAIKEELLANKELTNWVPGFLKEGRYHNWLKEAKDWAVSRNRYWGTPIPVWVNPDDPSERVCVGSIAELAELSGVTVTDLHREGVDHITIPSPSGNGVLKRIEEVFDCWFESGSMPYGQMHYPFENKDLFDASFPADFIAEGIDQCRGWFYTLMVLSTATHGKPAFRNVIVNGLVLAADGKKMSKRLKNYPDPSIVIDTYGADALRLYLITSPVVRGEDLRFKEDGVKQILRDVLLPWFNSYRFFYQSVRRLPSGTGFIPDSTLGRNSSNIMDQWVLADIHHLLKFIREEMAEYRLYTVVPKLVTLIGELTNGYIRFNRDRLKGKSGTPDQLCALNALFEVLLTMSVAMAPFTPFFADYTYQNLRLLLPAPEREECVHYLMMPEFVQALINPRIEQAVSSLMEIIELARSARNRRMRPLKLPLLELTVITDRTSLLNDLEPLLPYLKTEMNVKNVTLTTNEELFVQVSAQPDKRRLGKRLGRDTKKVVNAVLKMTHAEVNAFRDAGEVHLEGHTLTLDDVTIARDFKGDTKRFEANRSKDGTVLVVVDLTMTEELENEGIARDFGSRVQKLRKDAGLQPGDDVELFYEVTQDSPERRLDGVIRSHQDLLRQKLNPVPLPATCMPTSCPVLIEVERELSVGAVRLFISKRIPVVRASSLEAKYEGVDAAAVQTLIASRNPVSLEKEIKSSGNLTCKLNGNVLELELNEDVFLSSCDLHRCL